MALTGHQLCVLPVAFALVCGLAACGSESDNQLSAAVASTFSGSCTELATKVAGFANTTITAASTVATGTLKVAGQDIAEHCLVTGKMFERTGPIDGATYAIGFEIRLPKA